MPMLSCLIRWSAVSSFLCLAFLGGTFAPGNNFGQRVCQAQDSEELSEEEQRQNLIMQRYLTILERNPTTGTAFNRIYSMYVEQGRLDQFVESYEQKVKKDPENGAAWKILGMIQSQRGQEAEAIKAYKKAEELRPEDASVSYYLGQAYLLQSKSQSAIDAFERAIKRNPPSNELMEVYQSLGKVYQRMQQTEEALKVWKRLDEEFPDSLRVKEQIAITLMDESEFEEALKRYQQMEKETTDDYRQVTYGIKVAEVQLKLGKRAEALEQFEGLMSNLNPSSWLYRQVRDNIEEVFLKNDDEAGLTLYYQKWLEKNPRDIDAMARLSQVLFQQDRDDESEKLLRQALELAPSNTDLRNRLITQLIQTRNNAEAIQKYEQLNQIEPNNPETLRDWGFLIVLDRTQEKAERQTAAMAVWNKLLDARGSDPVIVSQVADWHREAEIEDRAIELYQKAIKLAPDNAQYREYLGEYYHKLKRSEEALATWKELVAGENRTTRNLIRLAEVLRGFGYQEEGLAYMKEACGKDVEYADRINYARMLTEAEQTDEALLQLDKAETLAENEEELQNLLRERIQIYQIAGTLEEKITTLQQELESEPQQASEKWTRLAMYYEASGKSDQAYRAVQEALKEEKLSLSTLTTAARIAETVGDIAGAISIQQRMLDIDRKSRPDYLRRLSELELEMGHHDQALDYAQQLLVASPGNVEGYLFYANLCFELGLEDDAFKTLRKAVRLNPNDQDAQFVLAAELAKHYRTEDAIELYWNAFNKADDLDSQLQAVDQLVPLYQRMGNYEELLERLEARRRERDGQRELSMVMAHVYKAANNFQKAREELVSLLESEAPDPLVLDELIAVAEAENEPEIALKYMQQLVELAPSDGNKFRLMQMQWKSGDVDQVEYILTQLLSGVPGIEEIHKVIDSLIAKQEFESALDITQRMRTRHAEDWELQLKEVLLLLALEKEKETAEKIKLFVNLDLPDETYTKEKARTVEQQRKAYERMGRADEFEDHTNRNRLANINHGNNVLNQTVQTWKQNRGSQRLMSTAIYTSSSYLVSSNIMFGQQYESYGNARMYALHWLSLTNPGEETDQLIQALDEKWQKQPNDFQAIWNRLCLVNFKGEPRQVLEFASQYIDRPEIDFAVICFNKLQEISPTPGNVQQLVRLPSGQLVVRQVARTPFGTIVMQSNDRESKDVVLEPVLTDEQLDLFLKAYKRVVERHKESSVFFQQQIMAQLIRHNREVQAQEIHKEMYASAVTPGQIMSLLNLEIQNQNMPKAFEMIERFQAGVKEHPQDPEWSRYYTSFMNIFPQMLLILSEQSQKEVDTEQGTVKLFEIALDYFSETPDHLAQRYYAPRVNSQGSSSLFGAKQSVRVMTQLNRSQSREISYPVASKVLTSPAIQVFYSFYDRCNASTTRLQKLMEVLEEHQAKASKEKQAYYHLVTSSFQWWNNQPEGATESLIAAIEAMPENDFEMQRQLIQIYLSNNEYEAALIEMDKIEPENIKDLQQRELAALNVAMKIEDQKRARLAAERLYAMRLDFNTQMELANMMKLLGMDEMAAATLKRSRQQAGSDENSLYQLMLRYQSEDPEIAAEIAMQLLQKPTPQTTRRNSSTELYQQQAAQVLQSLNRLSPLIEETEEKLEASPKSLAIMERLLVYLEAAGDRRRAVEIQKRVIELKPLTPEELLERADRAMNSGQYNESIEIFEKVLREHPEMASHRFYNIGRAYREVGRMKQMVDLLTTIDFKKNNVQIYNITNLFQQFRPRGSVDEKPQYDDLFRLLAHCWNQYENGQVILLNGMGSSFPGEEIWQRPELKKYLQEAFIPQDFKVIRQNPKSEFEQIIFLSYTQEGLAQSLYDRVIDSFENEDQIRDFRKQVAESVEKHDFWLNGKLLLCLLDVKLNETEGLQERAEKLINPPVRVPDHIVRVLAQSLETTPELQDFAITLYEEIVNRGQNQDNNDLRYRSEGRLLHLYSLKGRKEEGVKLLIKELDRPVNNSSNREYQLSRELRRLQEISIKFREFDLLFEAYVLNLQILSSFVNSSNVERYLGSTFEKDTQAVQWEILKSLEVDQVRKSLKSEYLNKLAGSKHTGLPFLVQQLLTTHLDESEEMKITVPYLVQLDNLLNPEEQKETPGSNLLSDEIENRSANVNAEQIASARKIIDAFMEYLKELEAEHPEEPVFLLARLSLQTLDSDLVLTSEELETVRNTLASLSKEEEQKGDKTSDSGNDPKQLGKETPASRFLDNHKKEAVFSSWLLAQTLWKQQSTQEQGDVVSGAVLESVRQMNQLDWLMSLLRSRGTEYLHRGESDAAEKDWREVLDLLLTQLDFTRRNLGDEITVPVGKTTRVIVLRDVMINPQTGKPVSPKQPSAESPASSVEENSKGPLAFKNLEQVLSLAKLMAKEGMAELSMEAVLKATERGIPLYKGKEELTFSEQPWNQVERLSVMSESFIYQQLNELEPLWRKQDVPLEKIYDLYVGLLFTGEDAASFHRYTLLPMQDPTVPRTGTSPNPFKVSTIFSPVGKQPQEEADHSANLSKEQWRLQNLVDRTLLLAVEAERTDALRELLQQKLEVEPLKLAVRTMLLELAFLQKQTDAVKLQLREITPLLEEKRSHQDIHHLCSILASLFQNQELVDQVLPVYKAATNSVQPKGASEPVSSALVILARYYVDQQDYLQLQETFQKIIDYERQFLIQRQTVASSRPIEERPVRLKPEIATLYEAILKHTDIKLNMEYLTILYDVSQGQLGELQGSLTRLYYKLQQLPPEERYPILHAWVFPDQTGKNKIRHFSEFMPADFPPGRFMKVPSEESDLESTVAGNKSNVFDTTQLLWETAREIGKEQELLTEFRTLQTRNREISFQNYLVGISSSPNGKATYFHSLRIELQQLLIDQRQPLTSEMMAIAMDALVQPDLHEEAKEVIDLFRQASSQPSAANREKLVRSNAFQWEHAKQNQPAYQHTAATALPYWVSATHFHFNPNLEGAIEAAWYGQNEYLKHEASSGDSVIFFKYPLAGNFEFSMETLNDRWAEGHLAYGGLIYQLELGTRGEIWGMGRQGSAILNAPTLKRSVFNEFKIKVGPENVKMFMNGEPFSNEDNPPGTSPWLGLFSEDAVRSYFRNLKLTGDIVIPQEVSLVEQTGLRGWIGSWLEEGVTNPVRAYLGASSSSQQIPVEIWKNEEGNLTGLKASEKSPHSTRQSYLYYHRPILDKDIVRYEFFYEQGKTETHPALGRMAFLIDPDQVRLHWIIREDKPHWSGLQFDNSVPLKAGEQLVDQIPLKEGEWNQLQLEYRDKQVRLVLNEVPIVELINEQQGIPHFGLFHYKDKTELKARNVVLSGDWPEKLSAEEVLQMMNTFGTKLASPKGTEEPVKPVASLIPEEVVFDNVEGVLLEARKQDPESAYAYLKKWVVPNGEHNTFRLYPYVGKSVVEESSNETGSAESSSIAWLDAPVFELFKQAKLTGKMEELVNEARALSLEKPNQKASQTGFLILAELAREEPEAVSKLLPQFRTELESMTETEFFWNHWPGVLVYKALKEEGTW
ncbi:MAG: DUF1583 domain-containing protein, partial [Planctomycetaceae bacterium]|nr:DUF1583 domain-containing protein [Planctomycetaceae bacterium]